MVTEVQLDEVWKSIPGYEDVYEASSFGRVRRIAGILTNGHSWKSRIIRQNSGKQDYLQVSLSRLNVKKRWPVHVLVTLAFHGRRPKGKLAAHKDGNNTNNIESNLMWATHKENQNHRWAHGTMTIGARNHKTVLSFKNVRAIRSMRKKTGFGCRRIAARLSLPVSATAHVLSGTSWRHYAQ